MFAVFFCGPTDCFLNALFMDKEEAERWAKSRCMADSWYIEYYIRPEDIDRTDTGWEDVS